MTPVPRPRGRTTRIAGIALAALASATLLSSCRGDDRPRVSTAAVTRGDTVPEPTTSVPPTTTAEVTTVSPPPPPPAPTPSRPATTAAPRPASPPYTVRPGSIESYKGLGTWVDVYDWSNAFTNNRPSFGVADVDRVAAEGVQTLYLQASKYQSNDHILEADRQRALIDRAHQHGMRVVSWYLPTFQDTPRDVARLIAIAGLPVDSIAVDIESTEVADDTERSRRLVQLSQELRAALPQASIGAIVLPPVVTDVLNTEYWSGFPWAELVPLYDVWMPMGYWTNRTPKSGYRDAYRYTHENVTRLRNHLGRPDIPIHHIGGLGRSTVNGSPDTDVSDIQAYRRAAVETGTIGGSIYDWGTTNPALWPHLRAFRG